MSGALIFLAVLLLFAVIVLAVKLKSSQKKLVQYKDQLEKIDAHFGALERELQQAREGRHDYKNHLVTINGLVCADEKDQACDYIEKLIEVNSKGSGAINCGNAVVGSILNAKSQVMVEKGITFKTDVTLPRRLDLSPSQLTAILSNLLDNAIAAAEQCNFGYVDLQLRHSKGNVVLLLKNPYEGEICKTGEDFVTSKPDSNQHGIGLKTVKSTVARMGGNCEIEYGDGIFSVFIMVKG